MSGEHVPAPGQEAPYWSQEKAEIRFSEQKILSCFGQSSSHLQENSLPCFKFTSYNQTTPKKGDTSSTSQDSRHGGDVVARDDISFSLDDLQKRDILGRSLLHILAILNDVPNLIKVLKLISKTNNHQNLLVEDVENHWNVLHFAIDAFNFSFVKTILNFNTPVLAKLLKHKDKNNLTPFDLLQTFKTTFDSSSHIIHSIDSNGNYKSKSKTGLSSSRTQSSSSSSSLIMSLASGEFSEINLADNLFPPPFSNPLLPCIISKFVSSSTHSALITPTGYLYLSNPQPTLFNSSFCRVQFFDDLHASGEKVIDIAVTSGHTVILTSLNRVFTFGNNIKRLNLYQISSSSSSHNYSKDFHSLIPISVSVKNRSSSITPPTSAPLSVGNNFSALNSLKSFSSLESSNIDTPFNFKGVAASNNHTVVYSKTALHIHGLNLGQFGPLTNSIQSSTKQGERNQFTPANALSAVASSAHSPWKYEDDPIQQVVALDLATLVVTQSSLIHVYVAGLHAKISLPINKDLKDSWNKFKPRILSMPKKIVKIVAPLSPDHFNGDKTMNNSAGNLHSNYSVLTLLDSGEIYVFTFPRYATSKDSLRDSVKFTLIWNPSRIEMRAIDVSIGAADNNNNFGIGAILCTRSGEAFKRTKTKWARINDVSNIRNVAVGYGFPIIGNFNSDDNPFKTILLRQEDTMLKHEITPSQVIIDFSALSPLDGCLRYEEHLASSDSTSCDIDFLSYLKSEDLLDDKDDYENDYVDTQYDDRIYSIFFDKHIRPLSYEGVKISYVPFLKSETFFDTITGIPDLSDDAAPQVETNFKKFYDYEIIVKSSMTDTQFRFHAHKQFLFNRLGIKESTYFFERKDLKFSFAESKATIVGDIDIRNVALFLHMLYTGVTYDIWDSKDDALALLKVGWDRLMYSFPTVNLGKAIRATFADDAGDVKVKLMDGIITTHKYLLSCRCDYFKQYFAEFWSQTDVIDFSHVSKYTWTLVMNYLSGYSNDEIFYNTIKELAKSCSEITQERKMAKKKSNRLVSTTAEKAGLNTSDDFVNIVLEVLYFSNELLLPNLRQLCELAIKDCINFDNYDIFLQHAFISGSKQLFANCGWFVLNNLSLCYNDQRLNSSVVGEDCIGALDSKIHQLVEAYIPERKKPVQDISPYLKQTLRKKKIVKSSENDNHNTASFMRNIEEFNGYYLHPYLWDEHGISEDQITSRTLMSRRKSQTNVVPKNLRSSSTSLHSSTEGPDLKNEGGSSQLNSGLASRSSSNESAISDDTHDTSDGFIVVQKARRKSSTIPTLATSGRSYSSTLNRPLFDSGLMRRDSNSGSATSKSVLNASEPWKIIKTGTSSADRSESVGSDMANNSVGSSTTTLDEILTQSKTGAKVETRPKSKITAPLRISQKERKLKEREESEKTAQESTKTNEKNINGKAPWIAPNAWGSNAPRVVGSSIEMVDVETSSGNIAHAELNTATILAPNKMNTAHFPSLEELRSVKVKGKAANESATVATGSSSANDFLYYEGHNDNLVNASSIAPNGGNKSLEEIREEEEFAKWWKEESERVQRALKQSQENGSTSGRGRNGNHNSSRGNRGGRGGRGGRGRGGGGKNGGRGGRGKAKGEEGVQIQT